MTIDKGRDIECEDGLKYNVNLKDEDILKDEDEPTKLSLPYQTNPKNVNLPNQTY